jgi:hypothetical protein
MSVVDLVAGSPRDQHAGALSMMEQSQEDDYGNRHAEQPKQNSASHEHLPSKLLIQAKRAIFVFVPNNY